jgi:metal-sulfur cluster biosynthetic enzyme
LPQNHRSRRRSWKSWSSTRFVPSTTPRFPSTSTTLGLIYDLRIGEGNKVEVKMTLTTPACPVAGQMPGMVEQAVRHVDNVAECEVDLVWEPPWNPDMMTEAARFSSTSERAHAMPPATSRLARNLDVVSSRRGAPRYWTPPRVFRRFARSLGFHTVRE